MIYDNSLKLLTEIRTLKEFLVGNSRKFNYPLLLIHGEKDSICDKQEVISFFKHC